MESDVTVHNEGLTESKRKQISDDQSLFCWGAHDYGQLGLGHTDDCQILSPHQLKVFTNKRVREISCGEKHSLVLLHDGTLYSCGNNESGQLGRDKDQFSMEQVDALATHIITQVVCGQATSFAVTDLGQLFSWGDNTYGQLGCGFTDDKYIRSPKLVKGFNNLTVIQVACGYEHCLALTDDGKLFSWGKNNVGQLGLGPDVGNMDTPQCMHSLQGLAFRQIAANGQHAMALSVSGALFAWGKNSNGQLGIGTAENSSHARLVKTLRSHRVKYVCCGEDHTVTLTQDGGVFTFGSGRYGQLGHNSMQDEPLPRKVFEVMGSTVTQVASGRRHTLVYIASSGKLYSFGLGANGQLGLGSCSKHSSPMPIQGPFIPHHKQRGAQKPDAGVQSGMQFVLKRIFTGGDHCFALVNGSKREKPPDDFRELDARRHILVVDEKSVREYSSFLPGQRPSVSVLNEVEKTFSSVSCLNGSFLLENEHYGCSSKHHGVNLEYARDNFSRIAKLPNHHISDCVIATIERHLLPSLRESPPDVEALRVYLTLPLAAAFTAPTNFRAVIVPFGKAVNSLQPVPAKVLEKWWENSPADYFEHLINIYKNVVVHILFLPNPTSEMDILERQKGLHTCMGVLERLNRVNMRGPQRLVPYDRFTIPQLSEKVDIKSDYIQWIQASKNKEGMVSFCHYPFVFDAQAKTVLLHTDALIQMQVAVDEVMRRNIIGLFLQQPAIDRVNPCLVLYVSRHNLVSDTINQLLLKPPADLKKPLKIKFADEEAQDAGGVRKVIFLGEDAVDEGGVRKEFFMLLLREVLDPKFGMFRYYEDSRLLWFNSATFEEAGQFALLGLLCGLAIYNATIIDLHFPLALYKKLLKESVSLDDMKDLQPSIGRSLEELLKYDKEDVEDVFCLTFEIATEVYGETVQEPLVENGANINVTNDNKKEYVELYIDYVFNKSVQKQFEAFYNAFHKVCGGRVLELFHAQELQEMVIGNENYDWTLLQKDAQYKAEYHADHPTIKFFWEVFHELSHEDKKNFLRFLTGSDRIPIHGMSSIKLFVQPVKGGEDFLPVAHTCFNLLDLPVYNSKATLRQKLLLAIQHSEGFGLV